MDAGEEEKDDDEIYNSNGMHTNSGNDTNNNNNSTGSISKEEEEEGECNDNIFTNNKNKEYRFDMGDDYLSSDDEPEESGSDKRELEVKVDVIDEIADKSKIDSRANNKCCSSCFQANEGMSKVKKYLVEVFELKMISFKGKRRKYNVVDIMLCMVVLINCVLLGFFNPVNLHDEFNQTILYMEIFFLSIYTIEFVLRIIAYGFRASIKQGWNTIHLISIILSWISVILDLYYQNTSYFYQLGTSISLFRAVRSLRPLRLIQLIPSLETFFNGITRSPGPLIGVLSLFLIYFLYFGIVGVKVFSGKLRQRCLNDVDENEIRPEDLKNQDFCTLFNHSDSLYTGRDCPTGFHCGVVNFNPNSDVTSFDNIFYAFLVLFQAVTMEGWSDIMYLILDTSGLISQLYFILVVIIGSLFLCNIFVTLIAVSYAAEREREETENDLEDDLELVQNEVEKDDTIGLTREEKERNKIMKTVLKKHLTLKDRIELRLMLSWELHHNEKVMNEDLYQEYMQKHKKVYNDWKNIYMDRIKALDEIDAKSKKFNSSRYYATKSRAPRYIGARPSMLGNKKPRLSFLPQDQQIGGTNLVTPATNSFGKNIDEDKPMDDVDSNNSMNIGVSDTKRQTDLGRRSVGTKQTSFTSSYRSSQPVSENRSPQTSFSDNPGSPRFTELNQSTSNGTTTQGFRMFESMKTLKVSELTSSKIYHSNPYAWFMFIVCVANLVVLMTERFPTPNVIIRLSRVWVVIFTIIYAVDILLGWTALGLRKYYSKFRNYVNSFVLIMSIIDCIVTFATVSYQYRVIASIARVSRLLVVVRVAMFISYTRNLLTTVRLTLQAVVPFILVLLIFLYICSIAGMHIFGGRFSLNTDDPEYDCTTFYPDYPHCPPRTHYDNFLWAFVTSFQILSGDNWNEIMYTAVSYVGIGAIFYFVIISILGNIILLNMLMAVLIDSFAYYTKEMKKKMKAQEAEAIAKSRERAKSDTGRDSVHGTYRHSNIGSDRSPFLNQMSFIARNRTLSKAASSLPNIIEGVRRSATKRRSSLAGLEEEIDPLHKAYEYQMKMIHDVEFSPDNHPAFKHNSLYCLKPKNRLRVRCAYIVQSKKFEFFILAVVILSCILLAVQSPKMEINSPELFNQLDNVELVVAIIFIIEAIMKIIAFGFVLHEGSYLRDNWNKLDFALVIIAIVSLFAQDASGLRTLRLLRAARILRLVPRLEGLRITVEAIVRSSIPISKIIIIFFFFMMVTAAFCVILWSGKLHSCYECPTSSDFTGDTNYRWSDKEYIARCPDQTSPTLIRNLTEFMCRDDFLIPESPFDCSLESGLRCSLYTTERNVSWRNPALATSYAASLVSKTGTTFHFDDIFKSLLVLFEISSLELWTQPMYAVSDIIAIGIAPLRGGNSYASLFFVIFVFFENILLLQFFVAVIVESFNQSQNKIQGRSFLTPSQSEWVEMQRRATFIGLKIPETPPDNNFRYYCWAIVRANEFEIFMFLVVLANTILFAVPHFGVSDEITNSIYIAEFVFGSLYLIEFILRISALGVTAYFRRRRYMLDFVTMLAFIIGWFIPVGNDNTFAYIIFMVKCLRILRLLKLSESIKALMDVLWFTLPALLNVSILILIVFFIFSVIGMYLFGHVLLEGAESVQIVDSEGVRVAFYQFINPNVNFNDFGTSLSTLFRMSTGESWNGIMHDLAYSHPYSAYPFCIIFVVLVQYIFMNLFMAVMIGELVQEFSKSKKQSGYISSRVFAQYARAWAHVRVNYERKMRLLRKASTPVNGRGGSFAYLPKLSRRGSNPEIKRQNSLAEETIENSSSRRKYQKLLNENDDNVANLSSLTANAKEAKVPPKPLLLRLSSSLRKEKISFDSKHEKMRLPVSELPALLQLVPPPLGLRGVIGYSPGEFLRLCNYLDVPVTKNGEIQYHATLQTMIDKQIMNKAFTKFVSGEILERNDESTPDKLQELLFLRLPKNIRNRHSLMLQERDEVNNASQLLATAKIANFISKWLAARKNRKQSNLRDSRESNHMMGVTETDNDEAKEMNIEDNENDESEKKEDSQMITNVINI